MSQAEVPPCIPSVVDIPHLGTGYELVRPLTDYRSCHDGHPTESRIVFLAKQVNPPPSDPDEELVVKVKVQEPNLSSVAHRGDQPEVGPSTTTTAELAALDRLKHNAHTPHVIASHVTVQGSNGPLPGGYVSYIVMTKLPGQALFDFGYREMLRDDKPETRPKRDQISQAFLVALRSIYGVGIEPIDRGLRNLVWDEAEQKCYIVDFEVWRETPPGPSVKSDTADLSLNSLKDVTDEQELLRWGLYERPPPKDMFEAWGRLWR